jgi:hypothetical protein
MKRRTWLILLMGGLLILWLAACSSNDTSTTPADEPEATAATTDTTETEPVAAEPEPTPEPATVAPAEEPEDDEPTPTEETEDAVVTPPEQAFGDAATALDGLDSYRYQTLFTFVGEDDGEIEAGSIELTGIVAGPDQMRLVWHDLGEDERFEVIRVGTRAWMFDEDEWSEVPEMIADAMTDAILIFAPSIAWGGIFGELEPSAEYVGQETVNGVTADRYTATYEQWGGYWPGALENAAGDVWIADEGYPVKYHFSATGVDEDGNRGTVTWRMDLTDVNADLSVEPPAVSAEEDSH